MLNEISIEKDFFVIRSNNSSFSDSKYKDGMLLGSCCCCCSCCPCCCCAL